MRFRKKKTIIITNSMASAALLVNWPTSPLGTPFPEAGINLLVQYFYEWAIALGGLAAFVILIIAGFQYLTSAGDPGKMREARGRIQSAVLGLVLLLGSWLILNTINPALTTLQPLTLDLESLRVKLSCDTDQECRERFSENYECKDNKCVPVLEVKAKKCESVTIEWSHDDDFYKGTRSVKFDEYGQSEFIIPEIAPGDSFSYIAEPTEEDKKADRRCMAILELYPERGYFTKCAGDSHQVYVSGKSGESGKASSPEAIQCVKLKEVPEW